MTKLYIYLSCARGEDFLSLFFREEILVLPSYIGEILKTLEIRLRNIVLTRSHIHKTNRYVFDYIQELNFFATRYYYMCILVIYACASMLIARNDDEVGIMCTDIYIYFLRNTILVEENNL